jgi:hypothetical protein
VIEDMATVVGEIYPEYFAEIASNAGIGDGFSFHDAPFRAERGIGSAGAEVESSSSPNGSGADPSPRRPGFPGGGEPVFAASVRDGISSGPSALSAAARNEMKTVETEIKYAGYLDQQRKSIERLKKAEQRVIPEWFDYGKVSGLSREMNEKLQRVRPRTLGHASRIPGVTPAAVSLINVYIEIQTKKFTQQTL